MNLIFLYGPPAVGKHTVGTQLAELTGYKLFHNHLTVPIIKAIFDQKTPAASQLLKELRILSIAAAAEAGINLIFTAAYSGGPDDEQFIQRIVDIVEGTSGGRMMFVQLYAPESVLLERVSNESRHRLQAGKMTDPERYRQKLRSRDIMVSVNYDGVLAINTVDLPPSAAAQRIARHFQL